jgi:hypothetical protein
LAVLYYRTATGTFVIVAGGYDGGYMSSVEIMEPGKDEWGFGPVLPIEVAGGTMVEDPRCLSHKH